jgi:predicted  nucleic acid-binding Zn-ribbon protein
MTLTPAQIEFIKSLTEEKIDKEFNQQMGRQLAEILKIMESERVEGEQKITNLQHTIAQLEKKKRDAIKGTRGGKKQR